MLENFLIGLALLTIGGLVTVAVNYPTGYMRIHLGLATLLGMISLFCLGYEMGMTKAFLTAAPFIPTTQTSQADAAAVAVRLPWWVPWSLAGGGIFLIALTYLRPLLGISDKRSKGNNTSSGERPRSRN